jgi:nitrile hydratase accessory protein
VTAAAEVPPVAAGETYDCRPEVERLVEGLADSGLLPRESGELSFSAPWEIRVFAIAVAASRDGRFPWSEFQERLVGAIADWEDAGPDEQADWSYYREWLHGLEALLLERALVDPEVLAARTQEYLGGARDPKHH